MKKTMILRADYLWDGIHDDILPHGAVLLENGLIKSVGAGEEIIQLIHDEVIDYPGGTLLPGLIDCHTHLSMDPLLENYLDHMSDPVPDLTIRAIRMMKKDLDAGITTCRCCGDKEFLDIACREAVNRKEIKGPHLLVATRGIRAPQGHGFVGYPFDGTESIRNAVRENAEAGADFIKIYITGTLRGEGSLPSFLSREQIKAAIDEAHDAGLKIGAHCVGGIGLDWALKLGLDSVEHGYHMTDQQIEELILSRTRLVLTPSPILMDQRINHLPADLIPGHLKERDEIADRMRTTILSEIPFAVGTDGMHGELVQEMQYLAELGASPVQALRAATLHGAEVCGIDHGTGSLEAGKEGDLVVVEGNPFEDLDVLRKVLAVWKHGENQSIRE